MIIRRFPMNILYLDWPCFGEHYILHAFKEAGYNVIIFSHPDYQSRNSLEFENSFTDCLTRHSIDFCFSFNYFHLLACCCHKNSIKYISMVYDSPYLMLYSYSLIYPTNYVFLFDKQEYLFLKKSGISTVYYSVLPVEPTAITSLLDKTLGKKSFVSDVSFVGSLYHEDHDFFGRLKNLDAYTTGYLDAIMQAQLKVAGYNFIEDVLTPDIICSLQQSVPYKTASDGVETPNYVYANYFINRKLTSLERHKLLSLVAAQYPIDIYTLDTNVKIPHAHIHGTVDYYQEMPLIFHQSKINLNITLRSIKSGIPLRALDIMASEGFLLTNFQEDFLDYFVPDEDFIYYESEADLIEKINYYLNHPAERQEIAHNGYERVKIFCNYQTFISNIITTAFC